MVVCSFKGWIVCVGVETQVFPLIVLKSGCSVSLTVSIDFISAMTEHRAKMQTFSGPHTHKHSTAYKDTYSMQTLTCTHHDLKITGS